VVRREVYRRRRWGAFLVFVVLVVLLFLLSDALSGAGKVARVQTPTVGRELSPPLTTGVLEDRLARIARSHPGSYETVVHDPDSGRTFGYNADKPFMAASLAKLPVLITLYKAAARGELSLDEKISILPSDLQNYGAGVLHTRPVGSTMTLRECASYLVKESDNTAWVMLERRLGKAKIEAELASLGVDDTDYRSFVTTPRDVLLMVRAIADPGYTTPNLSAEMLSLMTNTSYEDRLPEPLPEGTRVAHKIGSYGDTFSDAGVVFHEGPDGRENSYFIVAVGRNTTEDEARDVIREMSLAAYQTLAGER
jgi:beta-lactamase class A